MATLYSVSDSRGCSTRLLWPVGTVLCKHKHIQILITFQGKLVFTEPFWSCCKGKSRKSGLLNMVYKIIMGLAQEEQRVINVWIPAPTVDMLGSSQDRHLTSKYSGWWAGYSQGHSTSGSITQEHFNQPGQSKPELNAAAFVLIWLISLSLTHGGTINCWRILWFVWFVHARYIRECSASPS